MDLKKKYLRLIDKEKNGNKIESKKEKEENLKKDNSYLENLLKNSNKTPKYTAINLTSYNKNIPSFKVNIRDILSTEENKQKAINYVMQKRNLENFEKRNIVNKNFDINQDSSLNNNKFYPNKRYSKIFIKNITDINLNNNLKQKFNNDIKNTRYANNIGRRSKPNIYSSITNNLINTIDNCSSKRNSYLNKSSNKANENTINKDKNNNIEKRSIISSQINYYNNKGVSNFSPIISHNYNINNNNNYRRIKKCQINLNNNYIREGTSYNSKVLKISQQNNKNERLKNSIYLPGYADKYNNNAKNILINKSINHNDDASKKSYDLLPLNIKKNISIYYSRYSKKDDNKSKSKSKEYTHNYYNKNFIPNYKNFRISKQLK